MSDNGLYKILIVDDNEMIHNDFRKILAGESSNSDALTTAEAALFAEKNTFSVDLAYNIDSAYQGSEGLEKVQQSLKQNSHYALAFVDMRMPPGWDGLETVSRIWEVDPNIQVVICTAYSDYSWAEMWSCLGKTDKLLILKKPFDNVEVQQLASSLCSKWQLKKKEVHARAALNEAIKQLKDSNKELEKSNFKLIKARKEAEQASMAKTEFLANMSHELRTPLNAIIGFTNRLLRRTEDVLPERDMDALLTVSRNASHLLELINQILGIIKIDSGEAEMEFSDFDVVDAVRNICNQMQPQIGDKPIDFLIDLPDHTINISADITKVRQILTNLISNGIKYTQKGSITVTAIRENRQQMGDCVAISVTDTGVGIKGEDHDKLFKTFSQIDSSTTRLVGGTGLGLASCQRLIALHGGVIEFQSTPGKGSVFTAVFPCSGKQVTSPQETNLDIQQPEQASTITILCVDDGTTHFSDIQKNLKDRNYNTASLKSYNEALDISKTATPDILCLDICVPITEGRQVAKELLREPSLRNIPAMIISVRSEENSDHKPGSRIYLPKPIKPNKLLLTMQKIGSANLTDVLIVDDDDIVKHVITSVLDNKGLNVRTASNGIEALEQLSTFTPQVILLDLMMPRMDGLTLLEHLESDAVWNKIPVVILTAKELSMSDINRLQRIGSAVVTCGCADAERIVRTVMEDISTKATV